MMANTLGEWPKSEYVDLTLWQRLKLRLFSRVYLEHRQREGWSGELPIYAFRCPEHGVVVDYPHGYHDRLDCPYGDYRAY